MEADRPAAKRVVAAVVAGKNEQGAVLAEPWRPGCGLRAFMVLPHSRPVSVSEVVLIFICVPRLHDIGLTGWIAGGVFLLEIVTAIAAVAVLGLEAGRVALGLFVITLAGLLILLGALRGQKGSNRFGPPPRPGLRFWRKDDAADQTAAQFE